MVAEKPGFANHTFAKQPTPLRVWLHKQRLPSQPVRISACEGRLRLCSPMLKHGGVAENWRRCPQNRVLGCLRSL